MTRLIGAVQALGLGHICNYLSAVFYGYRALGTSAEVIVEGAVLERDASMPRVSLSWLESVGRQKHGQIVLRNSSNNKPAAVLQGEMPIMFCAIPGRYVGRHGVCSLLELAKDGGLQDAPMELVYVHNMRELQVGSDPGDAVASSLAGWCDVAFAVRKKGEKKLTPVQFPVLSAQSVVPALASFAARCARYGPLGDRKATFERLLGSLAGDFLAVLCIRGSKDWWMACYLCVAEVFDHGVVVSDDPNDRWRDIVRNRALAGLQTAARKHSLSTRTTAVVDFVSKLGSDYACVRFIMFCCGCAQGIDECSVFRTTMHALCCMYYPPFAVVGGVEGEYDGFDFWRFISQGVPGTI